MSEDLIMWMEVMKKILKSFDVTGFLEQELMNKDF